MIILQNRRQGSLRLVWIFLTVCVYLSAVLMTYPSDASPGAHGPNGEHLTTEQPLATQIKPRFETFSDQFELVAELAADAVVMQLHHFQDNSPVIHAAVEIETANITATALYDEKLQHYRITSPELLSELAKPQPHELVVTVIAADQADLLVASYTPPAAKISIEAHHDQHLPLWIWAAFALMAGVGLLLGRMSRTPARRSSV